MTELAARRAELLGGQRFTRPERTPLLTAMVTRAQFAIELALRDVLPDAHVRRDPDVLLSTLAAVIPDLAVYRTPTSTAPDLVVEFRAESTDRLFFGPKRLAYARARIPEVWFADPGKATVTVLRLSDALDYVWPAEMYSIDDAIPSSSISGLAATLLPSVSPRAESRGRRNRER